MILYDFIICYRVFYGDDDGMLWWYGDLGDSNGDFMFFVRKVTVCYGHGPAWWLPIQKL